MSAEQETGYTDLSFLSSLRSAPRKNPFKQLTLTTDLEQINQMLSPKSRIEPPLPTSLDLQLTKTFVLSLLEKYEQPQEIEKKWDGFIKSISSPPAFEQFVRSLKDISPEPRVEDNKANPEKQGNEETKQSKQGKRGQSRTLSRVFSLKKLRQEQQAVRKEESAQAKLKATIRRDLQQMRDLLSAGQKFIREA